jgi:hypothetical protein
MAENKKRDDAFINKEEQYEIDFIKKQYPEKDGDKIEKIIRTGNYRTHEEIYAILKAKGLEKKADR